MITRNHTHSVLRPDLEDLYKQLFERMSSGVAIYEAVEDGCDFVFVDFNSAGERIDDISRSDLVGERVTEAFPGVEEFGLLDVFRRVWQTGEAEHHPACFYDDGRVKGWRDNYVFKLPKTGHIVAIYDEPTDLRSVLDGLFGFVGIYMPDGVLVEANRAPLIAAGLTREDVIGKPFWETPWWSHSQAVQDQVRRALERAAAGETVRDEFSVRLGPETTITIDASFGPLRDQQGEITRLIGFGIDITERLQTESALKESEERFKAQFNGIPIPTYSWRKVGDDFELLGFNAKAEEITQGQIKRFHGTKASELYADDPEIVAWMHEVFERRCTETRELEYSFKCTGDVRDMRVTLGYGPPDLLLVHTEDVTARKKADRALKQSEARLANAQRIAHIGNWDWEIVAGELHWSDEIFRIFGLEPQQFGATYEAFLNTVHPEDRSTVERAVTAALEEDAPYSIEHRIMLPSGEVRNVHEQAEVERDENGAPVAMRGTVQDLTERRRRENAIARNWELLEDTLDNMGQGLIVFDKTLTILAVNPRAVELLKVPEGLLIEGANFRDFVEFAASRGDYGPGDPAQWVERVLSQASSVEAHCFDRMAPDERCLEVQAVPRSKGGFVLTYTDITERKRAEEALRQHAQIVDQIHDSVVSTDCDGVVTTWNKGAERLFGYTSQEAVGRHISFVYPEEERDFLDTQVIEPTERKGWHETEVRLRRKSGEDFIAHLTDSVLRNAQGEIIGRIGYCIDITERKLAADAARESNARIRGVLENVADGVITMTEDGLIESVNPAAEKMFGYAASEMVGKSVTMLMTGGDRKNHDGYVRHYLESGKSSILGVGPRELTARRKDGSTFPISLAVSEMQTGGQRLFIGSARDVTERKQWERDLRQKSAILQVILDTMDQGIGVIDGNFINVASNDKFLELLEFPPDMGPGTPFEEYIRYNAERGEYGPGDIDELVRERVELAKQLKPHQFERVRPDGTAIEIRGNPSADGGFVTVYTDVTERKRSEEALREALLQAETANRSKSEFLANMSHELRTPLNAIIGFSQVLQDELMGPLGDPSYRQYAQDIYESGTLLLSLIQDILDLSKIEAGKLELRDAKQSVPEIVGACRRIIEGRAKEAGLALETRLAGGLPYLRVDERALKQILLNLLSNAVKFTPAGGRVTVDARVDDDGHFAITVSDTGIGIAPADIPNALSNFGQVGNYLTREKQGTGLGLPLAASLAEAHGGTLELESELDLGTTARVRFPPERVIASGSSMARNREAGAA